MLVMQRLDVGNLRVIATILGQSVALDYYNRRVDKAIEVFTPVLTEIASSGRSETIKSNQLLSMIGSNSLLYTDVVSKLGLLDTTEVAWRNDKYFEVSALQTWKCGFAYTVNATNPT